MYSLDLYLNLDLGIDLDADFDYVSLPIAGCSPRIAANSKHRPLGCVCCANGVVAVAHPDKKRTTGTSGFRFTSKENPLPAMCDFGAS